MMDHRLHTNAKDVHEVHIITMLVVCTVLTCILTINVTFIKVHTTCM
jgi:hypothetical protein